MNVSCCACKQQMACIEKDTNAAEVTRSVYLCDSCAVRVEIHRQGMRREDVADDREGE